MQSRSAQEAPKPALAIAQTIAQARRTRSRDLTLTVATAPWALVTARATILTAVETVLPPGRVEPVVGAKDQQSGNADSEHHQQGEGGGGQPERPATTGS
jgi:hypothetical protein